MTPHDHASEAEKARAATAIRLIKQGKLANLSQHMLDALLAEVEALREECAALQAALSGRTGEAGSA